MIYVRDKGRMCNNILQYGHVYAFGREHGRRTLSLRFAYKYPWFKISTMPGHNFFRYAAVKYAAKAGLLPVVSFNTPGEDCTARAGEILGRRHLIVEGWEVRFYDLFLKYLDEIRGLFAFTRGTEANAERVLKGTEGRKRVGIHIRRGDYARWHGGRYFFYDTQYAEVIRNIAALVEKGGEKPVFFICGNDPDLDREGLRGMLEGRDIRFADGNPAEDLCLLSHCDLIAGPPSTFSLVAAMYRDRPLYRIEDPSAAVSEESFGRFATLFRDII